jgi:ABC-2 type transport system ATP-binding protein
MDTRAESTERPGRSIAALRQGDRSISTQSAEVREHRPDPSSAVCTRGLTKLYRGSWTLRSVPGLLDLDLDVRKGEVFGYLGPNGAGKTTTLKLLTGLHKPTRGRAWLLGVPIESTQSRARVGFLPEQPYFYDYLSGVEYLEFAARLSGVPAHEAGRRARHWLGRVGLGDRTKLILRKYSKGMLQRLGLAAALVHEPELLILDEPMSGLDPFGRRDVRELILEERERGVTVMFSSHILPDVEQLCDRVAIVLQGKLSRVATVGELVQDSRQRIEVRCPSTRIFEIPATLTGCVERIERAHETVFVTYEEDRLPELLNALLQGGVGIKAVTPHRATLEDLFMATAESASIGHDRLDRRSA